MRKITWECPHCSENIENSTYKITNGRHKGKSLKEKHILICTQVQVSESKESADEISSTEERVKKGEKQRKIIKENTVKRCPYKGCNKSYKGKSLVGFKKHLKGCSYRNQNELGNWVIRNARKYDFALIADQKEFDDSSESDV